MSLRCPLPARTVAACLFSLLTFAARAQQPAPIPVDSANPPAGPKAQQKPVGPPKPLEHASEAELKAEEKQNIAGFIPNMNTVVTGEAKPLTAAQKWNLAYHGAVNPFYFATAFALSGYTEVTSAGNDGFGWGPRGYFESVGANYLDSVNSILIGNAILPVLLHQDPRYFRRGRGTIPSRVVYSALQVFVCKGDNGREQFNTSNIAGNFLSGALSNAYYPASQRGISLTLEGVATVTAEGALGNQLLEFAPDFMNYLGRVHGRQLQRRALRQATKPQTQQASAAPSPSVTATDATLR